MNFQDLRLRFELNKRIYESSLSQSPPPMPLPSHLPPFAEEDGSTWIPAALYPLDEGRQCVLGSLCRKEETPSGSLLEVSVVALRVLYREGKLSPVKIIATRPCFPPAPALSSALIDHAEGVALIFRGERAEVWAKLGGSLYGSVVIDHPLRFENTIS